jgi:chromosome partitioning protein
MVSMQNLAEALPEPEPEFVDEAVTRQAEMLSAELQALRHRQFPPAAEKPLRAFSAHEAAKFLGVKSSYLRNLSLDKKGPAPNVTATGRRSFTAEQIQELRAFLDQNEGARRRYMPHRRDDEHLQVIAVANFKGGSCKTTTVANLAQHLALRGYRVLAIDLDPQASLSALHGFQPELDLGPNETLYGAINYIQKRPLTEIIRLTNFPGLHIVPASIELAEFEYDTPKFLAERNPTEDFFSSVAAALNQVANEYDVVIFDCPPQLGYLTMAALCAATSVLITVHPQMLDVMSMSQFLLMMGNIFKTLRGAGAKLEYDWFRYLFTRYEATDGPQSQMAAFVRGLFGDKVLQNAMVKSVAISDAGLSKQTVYEIDRKKFTPTTYDRAIDCLDAVNGEVEALIQTAWRR